MPEPVTVWMVHLGHGTTSDVEGTLSLAGDALVFEHGAQPAEVRFPFTRIEKVSRVIGSPVVLIDWLEGERARRTAFYFSPPPPLAPPEPGTLRSPSGRQLGPIGQMRLASKRRHRRASAGYLAAHAKRTKPEVRTWVSELRVRIRDAG